MPLFDIQCKKCNRIHEVLLEEYRDTVIDNCTNCNNKYHDVLPPLVAMHPDTMWSGVNTEQGYFTSKKQHLRNLKEKNLERVDRSIMEEVKKKSKNKVSEAMKKNEKKLEKFLEKELAPV